tara:strand:+ start:130 stop:438 length:309 start_codon:yes stop_codon:yes gene_type:complete
MSKELVNEAPFKVGDRVSHNLFGGGFVEKVIPANRKYYHIEVEFDEPSQSKNEHPTRFRKLIHTFLEKVDVDKELAKDEAIEPLEIEGLEDSNLVVFKFQNN